MIRLLVAFVGRALFSLFFISSALFKIGDWQNTTQYFNQALTDWLPLSVGYPWLQKVIEWGIVNAPLLLSLGVGLELLGGLLVFLGLWTRLGALLLIVFMIPTTLLFHHFWMLQGPDRQLQMVHFMKNLSIMGALLFLLAVGKGGTPAKRSQNKTTG